MPKWFMENQGLDTLEKDKRFDSYMLTTYFRCLAQHQGCSLKNLERKKETKKLASHYFAMLENLESLPGLHLKDLHAFDKLFGIHVFVYSLGEDLKVELVHRLTNIL